MNMRSCFPRDDPPAISGEMTMWPVYILLVFAMTMFGCHLAPPPQPEPVAAYAPYWYVDALTDSVIEVKNHLGSSLTILPSLTLRDGHTIELAPMIIPPLATQQLSLKSQLKGVGTEVTAAGRWGDGSRRGSILGNARLLTPSRDVNTEQPFSAWILVEDPKERLGLVSMFMFNKDLYSSTLHGSWWIPFVDTHVYFAVQNASAHQADLNIQLLSNGHATEVKPLHLPPFGFQLVALAELRKTYNIADVGGVRITATSPLQPLQLKKNVPSTPVVGRILLVQEQHGFSVALKMYPLLPLPPDAVAAELQSPAAYFGQVAKLTGRSKASIHPHLLLSNISERPVLVQGNIYGKDTAGKPLQLTLPPARLEPQSAMHLDLEEYRQSSHSELADGVAGLRLTHDGSVTDIIGDVINVDRTGDFALYDSVINRWLYDASTLAAISFNLVDRNQSFLILRNIMDTPQQAHVILDYAGGKKQYEVKLPEVPPQQLEVIDIRRLRDAHVADVNGDVLPASTDSGGAVILGTPGAFVGSDPSLMYSNAILNLPDMDPDDVGDDSDRAYMPPSCMDPSGRAGGRPGPRPPQCPQGFQEIQGATWFTCAEVDRGGGLACSVAGSGGQRNCLCANVTQTLGHTNIFAIRGGQCGDIYQITTPNIGANGALEVTLAERPDQNTLLDMHQDVIRNLGLPIVQGRYTVCIRDTGRHNNGLAACP